jgi:hypothetical protein
MEIINSIAAGVGITEQELQPILTTLNDAIQMTQNTADMKYTTNQQKSTATYNTGQL